MDDICKFIHFNFNDFIRFYLVLSSQQKITLKTDFGKGVRIYS